MTESLHKYWLCGSKRYETREATYQYPQMECCCWENIHPIYTSYTYNDPVTGSESRIIKYRDVETTPLCKCYEHKIS